MTEKFQLMIKQMKSEKRGDYEEEMRHRMFEKMNKRNKHKQSEKGERRETKENEKC